MTGKAKASIKKQVEALLAGTEAAYSPDELAQALAASATRGEPLRIKLGMDPTAPDIHLGHSVVLRKMRQFQDLGHQAVLIIGDYTARVGDPSGQNATRPVLSDEQIEANAATYFDQAGKILDTSADKLQIRHNSEWLAKLNLAEILRLAGQITVARMMERDTFAIRFKDGAPIGVHEFLYPLMQGYDSVAIRADVELGGTDQTFNNLAGRDIQRAFGQRPQVVLITPILVGLDGREKMSKSKGNYVGLTDPPNDMFGKVMSIADGLMANYFELLTDLPAGQIKTLTDPDATHPRQAKAMLAKKIVATYYDEAAAKAAAAEFDRVFSAKQTPADMPAIKLTAGRMPIVELITTAGFAASNSAARRLIAQSAVSIDGAKITDIDAVVKLRTGQVLRVGKRRFGKIKLT